MIGDEYEFGAFNEHCKNLGIIHETIAPYTP